MCPGHTNVFLPFIVSLIKVIFDSDLQFPALVVIVVVIPCLGGGGAVAVLLQREVWHAVYDLVDLEYLSVEARRHVLLHAPTGIEEVAHVHDVGAETEGVTGAADAEGEVVRPTEIETVDEGGFHTVGLGILALMTAQVGVLVEEVPEQGAV